MQNQANQAFNATRTHVFPAPKQPNSDFCTLQAVIEPRSPISLLPRTKEQGSIPFRHFDAGFRNYRAHATVTVLLPLTVSSFAV